MPAPKRRYQAKDTFGILGWMQDRQHEHDQHHPEPPISPAEAVLGLIVLAIFVGIALNIRF